MVLAHILISIAMVLFISLLGICVAIAFRMNKRSKTENTQSIDKDVPKRPIADIEDLDIGSLYM